jgi:hypothetical protein
MPWVTKINGTTQIQDLTIKNAAIATDAAIAESKLALDHGTQDLFDRALLIDENRTVDSGIQHIYSQLYLIDEVTGKLTELVLQNGVIVTRVMP